MLEFRTTGVKGFATKYSPFFDSRIAHCGGIHFGLAGNGRVTILGLTANGIVLEKFFDTNDVVQDIAWSESHENQIVAGLGDGSVRLFDTSIDEFPIQVWHESERDTQCVHWDGIGKDRFLATTANGNIKIFDPTRDISLLTLPTHQNTYSGQFSPHHYGVFCATTSQSEVRVYDLRTPSSANNHLVMTVLAHQPPKAVPGVAPRAAGQMSEVLTQDWNKYRPNVIATGSTDRLIRTFDLRNTAAGPLAILQGHTFAPRKVAWSPHLPDLLVSVSYDMTTRLWTDGTAIGNSPGYDRQPDPMSYGGGRQIGQMNAHSEFAMGVDWCMFGAEGWCASTGWDEKLRIWDAREYIAH